MNWKVWVHSAIVAVAGVLVGALEQYFQSGGVVPQNSQQWHTFISTVSGTAVVGIVALLRQSPLATKAPAPPSPTPPSPPPPAAPTQQATKPQ